MFEFYSKSNDAIAIIKHDHEKVKALFEKFEKTDSLREKKKIAAEAIMELKVHAEIEEKIFYPAVRAEVDDDLMNEADEEHHVAKLLIAELDQMDGSEDHWEAKFIVLAENIRHHIKEEEGEMLPQARNLDLDFSVIGRRLLAKKQELKQNGVPASDEEKMIIRGGRADSPAKAARSTKEKAKPQKKSRSASGSKVIKKLETASAKQRTSATNAKRRATK